MRWVLLLIGGVLLFGCMFLVGCYAPSPPSGAYLCAADGTCPSGQHCVCGLCVNHDGDAACGFSVDATI